MSIRRMNYTKRIDLKREHVKVSLGPKNGDGVRYFDLHLNLPEQIPADAVISVEAYRASFARMRFDFGTVGETKPLSQEDRLLSEFADDLPHPLFRIKVTGVGDFHGRLLADARQVRPLDSDDLENREGILNIHHKKLDGPIWEIDFGNTGYEPTLWIDEEVDKDRQLANDPKFITLVYPEVIRRVLDYLLIEDQGASFEDDSVWGHSWFKLAAGLSQMRGDPCPINGDEDAKRAWIDNAMRSFAISNNIHGQLEDQIRRECDAV